MTVSTYTLTPDGTPWAIPTMRSHPRLFLTPARKTRLQTLYNTTPSNMTALKAQYATGTGNGAQTQMGNMLKYLATGDLTALTNAYNSAVASTGGGTATTFYSATAPMVFDWGYADLSGAQKTALISTLNTQATNAFNAAENGKLGGCGNEQQYLRFIMPAIVLAGESGATDWSVNLRNVVQNICQWVDEAMADGQWTGYQYELTNFFTAGVIPYHIAGVGTEALLASRFKYGANRMGYLAYRNANNGYTMMSLPSDHKAIGVTTQSGPNIDGACVPGVFCPEFAYHYAMYADVYRDGHAQTAMLNTINNASFASQNWTDGLTGMNSQATWLAFIFNDTTLTPTAYSTLPTSQIFPLPGIVQFRGGWTQVNDVKGWLFSAPFNAAAHDVRYAGNLEISRGDDQLICTQYSYAGQPSNWQNGNQPTGSNVVGDYSMCKSTVLFSPKGSATPDRSGAQTAVRNPASATAYPISNRFGGTSGTWLGGTVGGFVYNGATQGAKTQATADYGGTYYPNTTVTSAQRIVAYVNGATNSTGTFFIQDNFALVPNSVDRIRALWGMRQKTVGMTGEVVVTGSSSAGVMTYPNQKFVVQWRNSQATIQMVSPTPTVMRMVGGGNGVVGAGEVGFESYFDGANLDYYNNAQSGKNTQQYKRIQGTWRLECETTPAAANGQMLFAITVGDIGSTAPTYTKSQVLSIMAGAGSPVAMPGLTQFAQKIGLNFLAGKLDAGLPTLYAAAFTTLPLDDGTGGVEVAGHAYNRVVRVASDWNLATGGSPATLTNATACNFPVATSDYDAPVVGYGMFDAPTGGNLWWSDFLGNFTWRPFTCSLASPGVITLPAHNLSNGDQAAVAQKYGGVLPTTAGSWAGLLTLANATTDTFTVGVNTTGTGDGLLRKVTPVTIANTQQLVFPIGNVTLTLA